MNTHLKKPVNFQFLKLNKLKQKLSYIFSLWLFIYLYLFTYTFKCSVTSLDVLQVIWTKLEKYWGNITQLFPQREVPFCVKFVYSL